jgi:PleD family two-component response regulator
LSEADASQVKQFADHVVMSIRAAAIAHISTDLRKKVVTISAGCATIVSDGQKWEAEMLKKVLTKHCMKQS